jgi:hypothetical protein
MVAAARVSEHDSLTEAASANNVRFPNVVALRGSRPSRHPSFQGLIARRLNSGWLAHHLRSPRILGHVCRMKTSPNFMAWRPNRSGVTGSTHVVVHVPVRPHAQRTSDATEPDMSGFMPSPAIRRTERLIAS